MNQAPDVELVLRTWLADDGDIAPDRVLHVVADRIALEPRRARRLPWRPFVNTYAKLAAGAAALLVVGIVGWQLLPGGDSGGRPTPIPTATAGPSPTVPPPTGPSPTVPPISDGSLAAGRYRLDLSFIDPTFSIVANVPAGWNGHPDAIALTSPDGENDGVLLTFMEVSGVYPDPCRWDPDGDGEPDQPADAAVGPTVADLVGALRANTSYTSTAPTPVTIGGFEGQQLELQLPADDVIAACDRRTGQTRGDFFVFPMGFYAQSTDSRWQLSILDVEGTRLVVLVSIAPGTPQADIAAAEAIVESFEITP